MPKDYVKAREGIQTWKGWLLKNSRRINLKDRYSASLRKKGGEKVSIIYIMDIIAENVRRKRKEKGWSQCKASEVCGISEHAFGEVERGKSNPTINTLMQICKGLEITPVGLMTDHRDEVTA